MSTGAFVLSFQNCLVGFRVGDDVLETLGVKEIALGTAISLSFSPNCWVGFRVGDDVTSMVLFTKGATEGLTVGGDVSETLGVKETALGTDASSSFPPNH